jgi:hypothetical protein
MEPTTLNQLAKRISDMNRKKGFWDLYERLAGQELANPSESIYGECMRHVEATKIALIHSELSEALEALRTDAADDKLPEYDGASVELVDTLIRILDYCGFFAIDVDEIVQKKLEYNQSRPAKHGKNF